MALTGTVNEANARVDLFVDWTPVAGTQLTGTLYRRVGGPTAEPEYVRGLFGTALLGEQAYVSDHEAPLDKQLWYEAVSPESVTTMVAGPFTISSSGYVWMKDPGRPWADVRLDLCATPSDANGPDACTDDVQISDTFTRTVASGWGTADTGQAWTATGGVATDYDVTGGQGRHLIPSGDVQRRTTVPSPQADVDIYADVGVDQLALTQPLFGGVTARVVDSSNFYLARTQWNTAGTIVFSLRKVVAGVATVLDIWSVTLPYSAGQMFTIRFQLRSTLLRAKLWPAGTAEPDEWAVQELDSSFTAAGAVGFRSVNDSATNVDPHALYDNLTVTDSSFAAPDNLAWVGFRDKVRAADAGLFPVLNAERPADVYARRKDITTGALFLSRSLDAITLVYELYTAGGPILFQVPGEYGMASPYGITDRYYQPDDLTEGYLSNDQRKPLRLWTVPLTSVDFPVGLPQGTDAANWCVIEDTFPTMADLTATGQTWGDAASGAVTPVPGIGGYGEGLYGDGPYGG